MKIVMEKYRGYGNDFLIWDPVKNKMDLDLNRAKAIKKSNLGFGAAGILYGPIIEDNNMFFKVFNGDGCEEELDNRNKKIFLRYMKDAGYDPLESCMMSSLKEDIAYNIQDDIHNTGFIILNNEFVKELEIMK